METSSVQAVALRLSEITWKLEQSKALSRRLSLVRMGTFAALAFGIVFTVSDPWYFLWIPCLALAAFVFAFLRHGKVLQKISLLEAETTLLQERKERLTGRRRSRPPSISGDLLRYPLEPGLWEARDEPRCFEIESAVLDDLDLVGGSRSLFSFLDTSCTAFGARRLLGMLRRPLLNPDFIRERQEAVQRASEMPDRIDMLLRTLFPLRRHRFDRVQDILKGPRYFAKNQGLLLWAHLAGTLAPVFLFLTCFNVRHGAILFLGLVVNLATIGFFVKKSNPARDNLLVLGPLLDGLSEVRRVLMEGQPDAAMWNRVATTLRDLKRPGRRLRRLIRLLELHDLGIFFEMFNILTLWELRLLPAAESLIEKRKELLERAALALGEIEALLSLSLPLVEQPGFSIPELAGGAEPLFEGKALGHPLIEPEQLVVNDIRLDARNPIAIITGSNMAGKSTLLKAVGTNLVLAGMGGPVQAHWMRWTPMVISSDINVRDSLDDGKSYFAVEVERVEGILRRAQAGEKILGLFDELFRGTNSMERQAIAMALLAHLRKAGGLYLVATHDLAITRLEGEIPGVANYHFRETVDGISMLFDYQLRPGPAPTRNAIRVLESRGYPEALVKEARERLAASEGNSGPS